MSKLINKKNHKYFLFESFYLLHFIELIKQTKNKLFLYLIN